MSISVKLEGQTLTLVKTNALNLAQRHETVAYIMKLSKPRIIVFIDALRKVSVFRKVHRIGIIIILVLLVSVIGLPWVLNGLSEGPGKPIYYLLGYFAVANVMIASQIGVLHLYMAAGRHLSQLVEVLDISKDDEYLLDWLKNFSARREFTTVVITGVFIAVVVGLTTIAFDKTNPWSIISASLGGFIAGCIGGSAVHFFLNFSFVISIILARQQDIYSLSPSETVGLRSLVKMVIQFTTMAAFYGTEMLAFLLLYLVVANPYPELSFGLVPAFVCAIFVWVIQLIPLNQTLGSITSFTRSQKIKSLGVLQRTIETHYQSMNFSDKESVSDLDTLIKYYDSVKNASVWPIELSSVARLILGFLVPLIPTVVQHFLK